LSRLNAADVWAAFLSRLIWMFFPRNGCYQAWLLKNSIFLKTAKIWGMENV
jgi:hypothetical protein